MKKTILLITFCLAAIFTAHAQVNKGRILIGGSGTFSKGLANRPNYTSFGLSPNVGFFLANQICVGFNASYNNYSQTNFSSSSLSIGPFARFYLLSGNISPFAFAAGGYGGNFSDNAGTTTNSSLLSANAGVGVAFFLNDHVALEPSLGWYMVKPGNADGASDLLLSIGLQVYLGSEE